MPARGFDWDRALRELQGLVTGQRRSVRRPANPRVEICNGGQEGGLWWRRFNPDSPITPTVRDLTSKGWELV